MTSTEKRLTILEEKNKQNDKELEATKTRLDNHDLQMQAAIDKSEKMTQLATATLNELINKMYPDDETIKEN